MSALSCPGQVLGTFQCLAVVLSYFCLFMGTVCIFCQTGTLDWMVVMAVNSWWLGSVILSCFTVTMYRRLSLFASCHLKSVEYDFLIFSRYK